MITKKLFVEKNRRKLLEALKKGLPAQYHLFAYPEEATLLLSQRYYPLDRSLHNPFYDSTAEILIKNGVVPALLNELPKHDYLLENAVKNRHYRIEYLRNKSIVICLLALKRRRIRSMVHLDRFLVKELAYAIYAARYEEKYKTRLPAQLEVLYIFSFYWSLYMFFAVSLTVYAFYLHFLCPWPSSNET